MIFYSDQELSDRETGKTYGMPGLIIDLNTGEIRKDVMSVPNVEDTIDASGYRSAFSLGDLSTGYHAIVDIYGNVIINCDDYSMLIGKLSDGVFFNENDLCFYDLDLNRVLDLSEYPLASSEFNELYFKDGYCALHATSNDDVDFYSLIDKNGEFIIDWTEEEDTYTFRYIEKLNDDTLCVKYNGNQYAFDITTSEMTELPASYTQVGEKLYYTEDGKLYYYSLGTKDINVVEIKCPNIKKQSLEAVADMVKQYMKEQSYIFEIDSYGERNGYYSFDVYSESEDYFEYGNIKVNPYTCVGIFASSESVQERWMLMQ